MKTVEIIGYKRANLGKVDSKSLRIEGQIPCVLYGHGDQVHFYSPLILFRDLVYTNEAHFVKLNIEGNEFDAILQDVQFHPVSEVIQHVDFLRLKKDTKVKMDVPVRVVGQAPGVSKGGTLIIKRFALKVYALPENMPDHIDVDVSELDFHHSIKVKDLKLENVEFLDPKLSSIAVIEVPRAAKMAADEEAAKAAAEKAAEKK